MPRVAAVSHRRPGSLMSVLDVSGSAPAPTFVVRREVSLVELGTRTVNMGLVVAVQQLNTSNIKFGDLLEHAGVSAGSQPRRRSAPTCFTSKNSNAEFAVQL